MKIETRKYLVLTENEEKILAKAMIAAGEAQDTVFRLWHSTEEGQRQHAEEMEKPFSAKSYPTTWDRTRLREAIQKLQAKAAVLEHCADDLLAALKETK